MNRTLNKTVKLNNNNNKQHPGFSWKNRRKAIWGVLVLGENRSISLNSQIDSQIGNQMNKPLNVTRNRNGNKRYYDREDDGNNYGEEVYV